MVSMTGSTARPTAQTPRRAVSELPHLCVRLCFFCSHSHSHWHSHFFSNVAHTHTRTRTHVHDCAEAYVRILHTIWFWFWVLNLKSVSEFRRVSFFFVFFAASSASFSICLINIRHSQQQCDFSRLSSLFISFFASPLGPFFVLLRCHLCKVVSIKPYSASLLQSHSQWQTHLSLVDITYTQCMAAENLLLRCVTFCSCFKSLRGDGSAYWSDLSTLRVCLCDFLAMAKAASVSNEVLQMDIRLRVCVRVCVCEGDGLAWLGPNAILCLINYNNNDNNEGN